MSKIEIFCKKEKYISNFYSQMALFRPMLLKVKKILRLYNNYLFVLDINIFFTIFSSPKNWMMNIMSFNNMDLNGAIHWWKRELLFSFFTWKILWVILWYKPHFYFIISFSFYDFLKVYTDFLPALHITINTSFLH